MRIDKLFASKPIVRYSIYGLASIVLLTLAIARPLYRSVAAAGSSAAQKGVAGNRDEDKGALEAARAALQRTIDSGTFELMSSAKQTAMLLRAKMRYEDGVLKEADALPAAPGGPVKDSSERVSPGDSPLAPLANPLVNNPAADATSQKTQSETTIILTGANSAVAAFNDSGSFLGGVNSFTGYSTSTDMGSTWTDRGIVPLLGDQNFGDPVLARSAATGTVFLSTLAGGANGMNVFRSTDGGVTFSSLSNGAPGAMSDDTDKEWLTVDNFAGTGNGNVYLAYRDFGAPNGMFFTRSTNDGISFSAPISIASAAAGNVQGAWVFVGADHAVYVGYYNAQGTPDHIDIRKSTDLGVTFAAPVTVSNLVTTATNGGLNVPAGYRSNAFPQFIASPANANQLFCIHPDVTVAGGSDSNIFFQQSTDGGATWSANVKLNTDVGTNAQVQPAITITPDGTALCVTWQDSRADAANRKVQRFGVIGTISGTTITFGPNFQVSQPDWTPAFGVDPVVNAVYMGDYDTMAADNSFFYTTFLDCRLGDQDVRFAKIPKAGPGAIIAFSAATPTFLPVATDTCNDLFVTLVNNGTATATGVSATFTTTTPGVTLQNATQSFGNIAGGASATNATPIKLSIASSFVCGTSIVIDAAVNSGEMFSFTIGTQGLGYAFTTMTGQSLVPGTVNVGNSGDDVTTNITIPFTFNFYGQSFTAANVSSNGNLQFTSNSTAFTNVCPLPAAALNNLIAPHWDDQRTDRAGGGIFTSVSGSMPNRIFNIEWRTVTFSTPETALSYEVRLYETTGQIDFIYANVTGNATNMNGSSASVGIQKGTGSGGSSNFTQFSCNTASLSNGLKVTFTPLTACTTGTGACTGANPAPTIITEVEPNGTPGTAQVLTSAENCFIVDGAVTPAGDLDYYRVNNVPAGAKAWFYTDTRAQTNGDTVIDIFAADGTTVIENDDDNGTGNNGDGTIESGFASSIAGRTLTAGGTYFFRVRGFGTFPGTSVVNAYRMFLVLTTTAAIPEVEPNGTSATANAIVTSAQPTGVASGAISSSGEVDFYSVQATAGNILFISMDGDPTRTGVNTLDGVVSLIAPDGTTVLLSADSGFGGANNSEGFNFNISTTGTYFVRVAGFSTEAGRNYNLMVSACGGAAAVPCVLTCPANITTSNDPNQCAAIVNYPPPTSTGDCGPITCTPPSGSSFPVGTTIVTCTDSGGAAPSVEPGARGSFVLPDAASSTPSGFKAGAIAGSGARPTTSSVSEGKQSPWLPPTLPQSPSAVLYSQIDNPQVGGVFNVTSQNFEPANDAFDAEVADDFVVPAGQNWTIDQVFVVGLYQGPGPAASANVVFYSDSSTLPGSVVATRNSQAIADAAGDFTITLSPSVVLSPGTYWVGVQANQNFTPNGQWFWENRAAAVNSGAAWRNVGNGFGTGCTSFGRKITCLSTQNGPDQLFQILGTSAAVGGGSTCTFSITVVDTQPPSITCPPNQTAVTDQNACPAPLCATVNYPPPVATDNCPGVVVVCNPPSGSCFPTGVTTVTCTATDTAGNTATCSFTVTTFDTALQDDSDPSIILLWNSITGQYRFCCKGTTYTGVGKSTIQGCVYTLQHTPADRRVLGRVDKAVHAGSGSIQAPPGTTRCTITDRNTLNDTLIPACQ